ncbi:MerR family transcriptional regulator [Caulobacter rhizosphaerae]|uniref:MerR family transcriptional regulator n=1 Tax=Caulobacter rhizosphaerae TaxID=2010972 RepID=UPI0013D82686|nr:MerR family transcriptional regulator [Caulobacter rhizosphaerae]
MSISQAAVRLGVTHRTLRHYEAMGLVQPQRPRGNTRAYDGPSMQRLELIVALRAADLPLSAVADILDREADPAAQALRVNTVVDAALVRARQAVARLEAVRQAARGEGLPGLRRLAVVDDQQVSQ